MLASVTYLLKSNYWLFKIVRSIMGLMGYFRKVLKQMPDEHWKDRIRVVLEAEDNADILRVPGSGEINQDYQVMHNGIKVHIGSYYGDGMTHLLYRNKGVHEPQEEKAFEIVLQHLPQDATMLELGAFWAFYSLSFKQKITNGKNYLIEPDRHALLSGRNNFRLNEFQGCFFNYYISDHDTSGSPPTKCIDNFMKENNIPRLSILHSDIQGYELKMLEGAKQNVLAGNIDYFFISTHSNELHRDCMWFLSNHGYGILCEANLDQSYSYDGLIVAKHDSVRGPDRIEISHRR